MSPLKRTITVALLCLAGVLSAGAQQRTNAVSIPFEMEFKPQYVQDLGTLYYGFVTQGTNRFVFLLPEGFRSDISPDKCSLKSADFSTSILLQMYSYPVGVTSEEMAVQLRERLLRDHPGAEVLEQFSLSAANHTGPAFDIQWYPKHTAAYRMRSTFIPFGDAVLELRLETSRQDFEKNKGFLNTVLITFRGAENGKLEIPQISTRL
jgi:hypothetical protein